MLSHEFDLFSEETIGAAYASIWMEGHEPVNDTAVMFHCDGDLDVLATVDSTNKLTLKRFYRADGKKWNT